MFLKKKKLLIIIAFAVVFSVLTAGYIVYSKSQPKNGKVYVAVGNDGLVAVVSTKTRKVINKIDLTSQKEDGAAMYMPHNVQVSPDGTTLWVTANNMAPSAHGAHSSSVKYSQTIFPDEVVVVSTSNEEIISRIALETNIMLAHIVLTPDSKYAYTTAQKGNKIYKINAETFVVEKEIETPFLSEPHGLRISPDGKIAYLAMSKGKSLGILDLVSDTITFTELEGEAVQTAVTPNNKTVAITLFDTKKVAFFDTKSKNLSYLALPLSFGPIQIYPTADSKYFFAADQGYYEGRPANNKVYKIDAEEKKVISTIEVGKAPHGIVLDSEGRFGYVSNLYDGTVSIIETSQSRKVLDIEVGEAPNGISLLER